MATYDATAKTLTRTSIIASTNGGAAVNWTGRTRLLIHALVSAGAPPPPPPAGFSPGAVVFDGQTWLTNFPAMTDSGSGTLSVWLCVSSAQVPNPFTATQGDFSNISTITGGFSNYDLQGGGALLNSPGEEVMTINTHGSGDLITAISNSTTAVLTFSVP